MSVPVVSRRSAAALFIERQHLERPRARKLNAARLVSFVEDAGGLQLDSINVVERAHYLTVFSRFGPYDKLALDRLVYRRRVLFEYWAHAACMVATTQFAPWHRAMLDYRTKHTGWSSWLKKNRSVLKHVEEAIRESGPLGSADFEQARVPGAAQGWWNWKPTSHALDYLWKSGVTLTHSRTHFHKHFDLAERVLPAAVALEPPDTSTFRRWHIKRSLHAMGAATVTDLNGYLTFPRIKATERARVLQQMLRDGEVVELTLAPNGARTRRGKAATPPKSRTEPRWFALPEDLPELERAGRRRQVSRGTTLMAPFDSFLWHRDRIRRLFGYDYTIEVYVPGHKRVHGYYSLPIFHDGQLIGRVDPKLHREDRHLELKHVHFEPWFAAGEAPPAVSWGVVDLDAGLAGVADACRALAAFVGAERVTWGRVTPGNLKAPLVRGLG